MRFLRRLTPKSLRARLLALLLGSLVVSQIVSLSFFFDERRLALMAAIGAEAVSRVATVARLLESSEPALEDQILLAASTPEARFSVDAVSAVAPGEERLRGLAADLLQEMSDAPEREARVAVREVFGPRPRRRWPGPPRSDDDDHPRRLLDDDGFKDRPHLREDPEHRRGPPPALALTLSVRLHDARWLNVEIGFVRPPLQWAWPSVVSMALTALAIVLIVTFGLGRMTRSLKALASAAERFSRGAQPEPVAETGPSEVRQAAVAFNAMQQKLSRFLADRTRLLASISHDLRTPLTSMRLRVELLEDSETKEKLAETLEDMQSLAESTLAFAKEEAEPPRKTDIGALIESVAEDFIEMGGDVTVTEPGRAILECRAVALKRALRNLIENALRYGERARVALDREDDELVVSVEDDGPGLPEDRIEEMFEPFTRMESSRSRETGGAGLGLSIARSVVRAHGGELALKNRAEGGLRAEIRLPKAATMRDKA